MASAPLLTAIICTHNPRADYLSQTLQSLRAQRDIGDWELLIIDNASAEPLAARVDVSWRPNARIVREERLGLTHARLRSFSEARGDILIYIDDDNVLAEDYFQRALAILADKPKLGAIGGRVLPRYEAIPPRWFNRTGISLACRDLGDAPIEASWNDPNARRYPECAPIGAGMVLRRIAYATYVDSAANQKARLSLGRRGGDLASGEDNDMVLTLLNAGWTVAYDPSLILTHLIPSTRLARGYLRRYAYASNRTWVQVLGLHGISPWDGIRAYTAPLRKARAYFRAQTWKGPVEEIAWASACGLIDGRAALGDLSGARDAG